MLHKVISRGNKGLSIALVFTMLFSTIFSVPVTSHAADFVSTDFLKTSGTVIKNNNGTGEIVDLHGTNLGGWLMQEDWLSPLGGGVLSQSGWTATASVGGSPGNAIDGNPGTSWTTGVPQEDGQWFKVDMGSVQYFDRITFDAGSNMGNYPAGSLVQISSDGISWSNMPAGTLEDQRVTVICGAQAARYILIFQSGSKSNPWSIAELNIYMGDDYNMRKALYDRFGQAQGDELILGYQNAWLKVSDLDNIKDMGMNYVRVPISWLELMDMNGNWKTSAWTQLDWLVNNCKQRGIYVVLDLHASPGGASPWASSGQAGPNPNRLWTNPWNQDTTVAIWQGIAEHYKGNATIAGYELVNEPVLGFPETEDQQDQKNAFLNRLYTAVRAIDPDHIIFFGALGSFDAITPPSTYGWTNVAYTAHPYAMEQPTNWDVQNDLIDTKIDEAVQIQNSWNVPVNFGEYNFYFFHDLWEKWMSKMNENHISWANWTYKVRGGMNESGGGNFGFYNTDLNPVPDVNRDDANTIAAKWSKFSTDYFAPNTDFINVVSKYTGGSIAPARGMYDKTGWTASASVTEAGQVPGNALDNNNSTWWSTGVSQANGQWFQVDMGESKTFDQISFETTSAYSGDYPISYVLQVSGDGNSWATLKSGTGFGNKMVLQFPQQSARYIKILQTGSSTEKWWRIGEFNVYSQNIALNKSASASSGTTGNSEAYAFDGNSTTRWESAASDPQWITVDLSSVYKVKGVQLNWALGSAKDYKIQVSADNVNWTDAYTKTGGTGGIENITFNTPVTGQYVRMQGTARTSAAGYSLREFEVYGLAVGATQKAKTPVITPVSGTYATKQTVRITSETPNATIRYTLDGSAPTATAGNIYTGAFTVSDTTTVKAIAYKAGMIISDTATSEITIAIPTKVSTPVISPPPGVHADVQTVSIKVDTPCDTIMYTIDGSTPTAAHGIMYDGIFTVSSTATVKAMAIRTGLTDSDVATSVITIQPVSINPPSGLSVNSAAATSVSLKWASVSGAAGYNLYRSFTETGIYTKVNDSLITSTGYTDTGLDSAAYYYKTASVKESGESLLSAAVSAVTTLDFGDNVKIFDPSMSSSAIQTICDTIFNQMQYNEFGYERYALLFKPGSYNANINVGFYTQVAGLGQRPDDVTITGSVRSEADWNGGNATMNFWRTVENFADIPTYSANPLAPAGTETWAVSQAAPMRRVHVKGDLMLWDPNPNNYDGSWSSGGYIADSIVDGTIYSGSQQQFFTRNSQMKSWNDSNWNMMFVGDTGTPAENYETKGFTVINQTPVISEKPFLYFDGNNYRVFVPGLRNNVQGVTWQNDMGPGTSLSLDRFVVAHPDTSTAASLNQALKNGKNILFTPGIYHLSEPLRVTQAGTVLLGLGLATLTPDNGTAAMTVADVDGVKIAGILFEAGLNNSKVLLQVGPAASTANHSANPSVLSDLFFRVGGTDAGKTDLCVAINSSNVIGDHFWVWRADHGAGVGWTENAAKNGLIVNGDNVTIYGLFCEHFNQHCTIWNGNGGRVYFYQSEIAYDVPDQASFMDGTDNGYASYKVADTVTSHEAWGMGVYSYFKDAVIKLNSAIKCPDNAGIKIHNATSVFLNGNGEITHIVNNTGDTAKAGNMRTLITDYSDNVEQPDITPITGMYASAQTVTISDVTPGTAIRYTVDGSNPTASAGTIYTEPFEVSADTTVKAIAYKAGMKDSYVAASTIKIDTSLENNIALNKSGIASTGSGCLAFDGYMDTRWASDWTDPQWITVDLGSSYSVTGVKLSWETAAGKDYKIQVSGDNVHWTDAYKKTGGTGGTESIIFEQPVMGQYVRMLGTARATGFGYSLWEFEVNGTPVEKVASPVITSATGTYGTAQTVTITDATEGAAIRYTMDGTAPSEKNGTVYTEPFTVSATTTVKAAAYKSGMAVSDTATSVITISAVPVSLKIEAENYINMSGVAAEPCNDIGGGQNVGYIDMGDWMDYTVTVATAGTYTVDYRVNGWDAGAQIQLMKDSNVLATTGTNTGNAWATVTSEPFPLTAGTYTVRVNISGGGFNLNWMEFKPLAQAEKAATPVITPASGTYGTAQEVTITDATGGAAIRYTTDGTTPSETNGTVYTGTFTVSATTTVKAVAYKSGMTVSDIAASVITISSVPVSLKIEAENYINMSGVAAEPCNDIGGGQNVGYIDTGDWMDYTVTVATTGTYTVDYRVNGWNAGAQIQLMKDSNVLATTGTNTGNAWATVTSEPFPLTAGTYTVRVNISGGGFNLNWMEFKPLAQAGKAATPVITPASGTYGTAQEITITDATEGTAIRYTTDGTAPSETNGTVYTGTFTVSATTTVKAVAYKSGMTVSDTAASVITISSVPVSLKIEAENYTNMSGVAAEPCNDTSGGENVGYIDTGDWMDYTVTVATTGTYTVDYRVNGWDAGAQIQLMKDGNVLAATGTNTGNIWATVTSGTFHLTAGTYTIRLNISGGKFNLNWMNFNLQ
ncbi:chitobiase/beta-hexosaminidase C-terminal domain-containing protein [Anaerocolumna xylanovorans]|uniref:Aryl-phospho-beta-D-glucosidase BglC, GH1 family n=1 Tax=Anaerocolumna xylanovorans DSM 12503 TaxID=1121345 RepID=A0A1M7Y002_9FIRM|nr:chitobiase/beta-hexosaminidase C-terminal domain-containing protein [Anaerocolumna xylanovorans]SHO44698.1 Aryl-phospho-beta-D-glucosidase BglC, GH1 family [Anaerocolumna xylanovorans DSM 12503]